MCFTEEQKEAASRIVAAACIHQEAFLDDEVFTEQFNCPYTALDCFLRMYAYERQGAPKAYSRIAVKIIRSWQEDEKTWQDLLNNAEQLWAHYCTIAKKEYGLKDKQGNAKVNNRRNPMNSDGGIIQMLQTNTIGNIAVFVREKLNNGETRNAFRTVKSIRGIGDKIASLYLRDIACLSNLEENNIQDLPLLQPIDTWLEQTLRILIPERSWGKLVEKQQWIVNLCSEADVSSIAFNQGAWTLGSQICEDFKSYEETLMGNGESCVIAVERYAEKMNRHFQAADNTLQRLNAP